jgi:UDP-N-acetylmuramate: L-alanyl-gamma-D-glutamyl-meso-diaminopimelate ligase
MITKTGTLIYFADDPEVVKVANKAPNSIKRIPYTIPEHIISDYKTTINIEGYFNEIMIFGKHNLANLSGAWHVCKQLGISANDFLAAISSYKGASNRLEKVFEQKGFKVFRDFAHSPSKLKATVEAVKNQFPEHCLIACMELHTYSSLNAAFLNQYEGSMDAADVALVYYNPHALELKRLPALSKEQIKQAFKTEKLLVFNNSTEMTKQILSHEFDSETNILFMSSGDFNGLNISELVDKLHLKISLN